MTAPEPSQIKLITMTVRFLLDRFINLRLLAEYIEIDSQIIGVKYEETCRGTGFKKQKTARSKKQQNKKTHDFKNQCTVIVNAGGKLLNTKIFNNGKLVFTGCTDLEQIKIASTILVEKMHKLVGYLEYQVPVNFKYYSTRDIFRKEIFQYKDLIHLLAFKLDIDINAEPFNPALNAQESFKLFTEKYEQRDHSDTDNLLSLLEIIKIFKSYYHPDTIKSWRSIDDFPDPARKVLNAWNRDEMIIADMFPVYLDYENKIPLDFSKIKISNINNRMTCNFPLNRERVMEILQQDSHVLNVDFDEDRYPGVVVKYKTDSTVENDPDEDDNKPAVIIFFNSGKINTSASKSFEQVNEIYNFITTFCRENYSEIVMESSTVNEEESPDQFALGEHEGVQYLLLRKNHILKNPRNVFLLKKFNLLDEYH